MFKDIMVHLDGSEEDEFRLRHAEAIAVKGQSHIIGLYTNNLPEYAYVLAIQSGLAPMEPVVELAEQVRRKGDRCVAGLTERCKRIAVETQICRLEALPSEMLELCVAKARCADLFVATAPYRHDELPIWDELIEAVMFDAGQGIYLIPSGAPARPIGNILVAWRDTRESARAVAVALPFLKVAARVRIVMADAAEATRDQQAKDLIAHLARHDIKAEVSAIETAGKAVSDVLLREAHRAGADLIVMGSYGHSRFREWILGGATREMIEKADLPMLMVH
jgi:nucleotide-binding universal stress UspA family protein